VAQLLDVSAGERILYVGDHMYSDILRSKRSLGWRTCLVVPELETEIAIAQKHYEAAEKVREFRQLQVRGGAYHILDLSNSGKFSVRFGRIYRCFAAAASTRRHFSS